MTDNSSEHWSFVAPAPSPLPLGGFMGRPSPGFAAPRPGFFGGTPGLPGPPLPPQPLGPEQPWPDKPRRLPFKPFTPDRSPFGKRVPLPFVGPRPGIPFPWLRFAGYLGLAFEAGWYLGEVYEWYSQSPKKWTIPPGWIDHYGPCVPPTANMASAWSTLSATTIPSYMKCTNNQVPGGPGPNSNVFAVGPGTNLDSPALARFRWAEVWLWPIADPVPLVTEVPLPIPLPPPVILVPPYYDPTHLPIYQPVPIFKPRPLKAPPPYWRSPGDPTPVEEAPNDPPVYWPAPPVHIPGPARIPVRGRPSYSGGGGLWEPAIEIEIKPPWPSKPNTRPGPRDPVTKPPVVRPPDPPVKPEPAPFWEWKKHYKQPPRRRERERKARSVGGQFAPLLWGIANGVTETTDVIDALYDALPWQLRRFKGRDGRWRDKAIAPQDRLPVIAAFIAYSSEAEFAAYMGNAAVNIAANQIEDFAIGKLASGRIKAYLKNAGGYEPVKPTGVGLSTGGAL